MWKGCQKHQQTFEIDINSLVRRLQRLSFLYTPITSSQLISLTIPFLHPISDIRPLTILKHIIPRRNPRIRNDIVHASMLRHPRRLTEQRHLIRPAGDVAADKRDIRKLGSKGGAAVGVEIADADVDAGNVRCFEYRWYVESWSRQRVWGMWQ